MKRDLVNLVSNAIKYGDSRIPVTVAFESPHGSIVISVRNEGVKRPGFCGGWLV